MNHLLKNTIVHQEICQAKYQIIAMLGIEVMWKNQTLCLKKKRLT